MSLTLQQHTDIPKYIFGDNSTLVNDAFAMIDKSNGSSHILFTALITAIAALYLIWLNHWSARGNNHVQLFKLFGYMRSDYVLKLNEASPSFSLYTMSGATIGLTALWIITMKFGNLSISTDITICGIALACIIVSYLYQITITELIGRVTGDSEFTKIINCVKNICFSILGIMIIPTALCYSLSNNNENNIFTYIIGIQLIAAAIIFIHKIFILFISKKVSVLHTILYLCAVEIFPISLIWGFFHR